MKMTDMVAQLERGHALVPIIHAQLDKPYLQPLSLVFSNFNWFQKTIIRGSLFQNNLQVTHHQNEVRCHEMEKRGKGFIQSVKNDEVAYAAQSDKIASIKIVIKSLDQEDRKDRADTGRIRERALKRYTLLRRRSEITKEINKICYEWETLETNEAKWRDEYNVAVDENAKFFEEIKWFRENLCEMQVKELALLERIAPLRKCDCEGVCMITDYEHKHDRKDEWKMGVDGL